MAELITSSYKPQNSTRKVDDLYLQYNNKFKFLKRTKWRCDIYKHVKYDARVYIFLSGRVQVVGKIDQFKADRIIDDLFDET